MNPEQTITPASVGVVRGDPVHRYRTALDYCVGAGASGVILDVGGSINNPAIQEAVPSGTTIVSVNLPNEAHGRKAHIQADGRDLHMFSGDVFPCVTGLDVVEHVPHEGEGDTFRERLKFAKELVRVSSNVTVLTAPFHNRSNERKEQEFLAEMERLGLDPKHSIFEHRERGLPSLKQLVKIGRALRRPFDIRPATNRSTLFQSLYAQAYAIAAGVEHSVDMQHLADQIAVHADKNLQQAATPDWEEAYRAVMVIYKNRRGENVTNSDDLFLAGNELMAYQAAFRRAGWGHIPNDEVIERYKDYPLRGRTINIEGPEGTGKTTLVRRLSEDLQSWGYTVATQTDHGLRQWIRDMEKSFERVIDDPERAEYFLFAMWQAAIAGNAFTLLGPCFVNISDRGLKSVEMHHGLHCPDNRTIPFTLNEQNPLQVPPDLTIILGTDDGGLNLHNMQKDGGLVNATKGWHHLDYQRGFYANVREDGLTGEIVRIQNPGIDGTWEDVVLQAKDAIEGIGIPTSRPRDEKFATMAA